MEEDERRRILRSYYKHVVGNYFGSKVEGSDKGKCCKFETRILAFFFLKIKIMLVFIISFKYVFCHLQVCVQEV